MAYVAPFSACDAVSSFSAVVGWAAGGEAGGAGDVLGT